MVYVLSVPEQTFVAPDCEIVPFELAEAVTGYCGNTVTVIGVEL